MLPADEGTLWHSNSFETVAAALLESTQNARMEREQGNAFVAEGSDALLDRLDRVMADEFEAKMLGRVGRGHLAEVKFFKRTLFQLERGNPIRHRARCVAWTYRHAICDDDTHPRNEDDGWKRS